jgi:hypothetical protein
MLAAPAWAAELSPNLGAPPPDGAVVLFDGSGTEKWRNGKMTEDGYLKAGTMTKDAFGDFQLHLEFLLDFPPEERKPGNSGVYLQRRYEVQILNMRARNGRGRATAGRSTSTSRPASTPRCRRASGRAMTSPSPRPAGRGRKRRATPASPWCTTA